MNNNENQSHGSKAAFWGVVTLCAGAATAGLLMFAGTAAVAVGSVSVIDAIVTGGAYVLMATVPGAVTVASGYASLKQLGHFKAVQSVKSSVDDCVYNIQNQNTWMHRSAYTVQDKFCDMKDSLKFKFQLATDRKMRQRYKELNKNAKEAKQQQANQNL